MVEKPLRLRLSACGPFFTGPGRVLVNPLGGRVELDLPLARTGHPLADGLQRGQNLGPRATGAPAAKSDEDLVPLS